MVKMKFWDMVKPKLWDMALPRLSLGQLRTFCGRGCSVQTPPQRPAQVKGRCSAMGERGAGLETIETKRIY